MSNKLVILGQSGDEEILWDTKDLSSVETADQSFTRLIKQGYLAFDKEKGNEQVRKFDPNAHEITFVPRHVGG